MSNSIRLIAFAGLWAASSGLGLSAWGQEPVEPEPAVPVAPAEPAPLADEGAGRHFGLYLSASVGTADGETLNTSLVTRQAIDQTISSFELPEQQHGRAAIGWKLRQDKGDFRLAYTGYKEDTYEMTARGQSVKLFGLPGIAGPDATDFVDWWSVSVENGQWVAARTPRLWVATDDANLNGAADPEEVRVGAVDRLIQRTVPESMNNRLQTYDLLYGREFGGRRYSSRWWGGLRYYQYSGQIVVPAWLAANNLPLGNGFTDEALVSPLLLEQDASGAGPTGSWEVDFNFLEKRVVLYLRAQTAFVFSSLEVDSGLFFTVIQVGDPAITLTPPSRLTEERDKSVWQNTAEIGGRLSFRRGLGVELGYSITGYLDTLLLPNLIIVPETQFQSETGSTALYSTQDYDVTGWHVGLSYQF